LAQSGHP